jgi:hypothetical protein
MGRLIAEAVKGVLIAAAIIVLGIAFGVSILPGFGVVIVVGVLMLVLNVRAINNYD